MLKKYNITVNGNTYEVEVEEVGNVSSPQPRKPVQTAAPVAPKVAPAAPKQTPTPKSQGSAGAESVNAPMPGTINDVKVNVGDNVKKGQVLVILEAMKMENEIMASVDGVVASVNVSKGSSVSAGDVLVTLN